LEHQAKVAADRSAPIPPSSDPQLKILLIAEVKRSDETIEPKRAAGDPGNGLSLT